MRSSRSWKRGSVGHVRRPNRARDPGIDLIIWVEPGTGEEPVGEIRRTIDSLDGVVRVDYFDSDAAYEEFLRVVPDGAEDISVEFRDLLPTSFRVTVPDASDRAALITSLVDMPGVREIALSPLIEREFEGLVPCPFVGEAESIVVLWGRSDASAEERNAIRSALANDPLVRATVVVDDDEVLFAEFQEIFRDQPDAFAQFAPGDLPWRIEITVATAVALEGFGSDYVNLDGVRSVLNPMDAEEFGCE